MQRRRTGRAPHLLRADAGALLLAAGAVLFAACAPGEWPTGSALGDALSGALVPPSCVPVTPLIRLPRELPESSGLVFGRDHPGVLWTHNDSGGTPELFALDREGGLIGRVRVTGARNRDWEDLAVGPCSGGHCLYIADVGDNREIRDDLVVYRVREPDPRADATDPSDAFPIRVPHGPRDIEAIFLLPGERLHFITKGRNHPVEVYRYPGELRDEVVVLERVQELSAGPRRFPWMVTGGAAATDGDVVAVRSYSELHFHRTIDRAARAADAPSAPLERVPFLRVNLLPLREPQGEAVALGPGDTIALSGERAPGMGGRGSLVFLRCAGLDSVDALGGSE